MFTKRLNVGVDIGGGSLKVVKLLSTRNEIKLQYASLSEFNFVNDERNKSQILENEIKEIFKEGNLWEEKISINFTDKPPIIKFFTLPKMPLGELNDAVQWEAKKILSVPMESVIIDFLILGEVEEQNVKKYEILIVAADKKILSDQVNLLKGLGLKIRSVDVNPLALLNSIRSRNGTESDSNMAYIDIGTSKTEIDIIKNGALRFTRSIATGGDDITRSLSNELGISKEEAEELKISKGIGDLADKPEKDIIKKYIDTFVLETQRSIDYYRAQLRQGEMKKIVLIGGTPLMPGFLDCFSSYFETTVEIDNPFSNIKFDDEKLPELSNMSCRFSSCIGLALRSK